MSGNRLGSSTFDNFIAYDLLPSITRLIVGLPFCWLYPNLHHQNVALRTAFLDNSLLEILDVSCGGVLNGSILTPVDRLNEESVTTRVITLGAGFDTRSLRFQQPSSEQKLISRKLSDSSSSSARQAIESNSNSLNADFYEVDLPSVVSQKENIFKRFLMRRPNSIIPKLYGADLNEIEEVKSQLSHIFTDSEIAQNNEKNNGKNNGKRPTVFIIEAVLMYLKEENVMPLLSTVMKEAAKHSSSVHLCFADRLPGMPHNDTDLNEERIAAIEILRTVGLELTTWQPKPGRARHMGIAKYSV